RAAKSWACASTRNTSRKRWCSRGTAKRWWKTCCSKPKAPYTHPLRQKTPSYSKPWQARGASRGLKTVAHIHAGKNIALFLPLEFPRPVHIGPAQVHASQAHRSTPVGVGHKSAFV